MYEDEIRGGEGRNLRAAATKPLFCLYPYPNREGAPNSFTKDLKWQEREGRQGETSAVMWRLGTHRSGVWEGRKATTSGAAATKQKSFLSGSVGLWARNLRVTRQITGYDLPLPSPPPPETPARLLTLRATPQHKSSGRPAIHRVTMLFSGSNPSLASLISNRILQRGRGPGFPLTPRRVGWPG